MGSYFIGINLLKQCLFGVGYCMGSWSLCIGPLSIEIHPLNRKCGKLFSFCNEFAKDAP